MAHVGLVGCEARGEFMKLKDVMTLSALLALVGAVYCSTLAVNHSEAEDSLRYLKTISTGSLQEQFHPHHLLYHIVNFALYHGIHAVGIDASVEATAQALSAVFGVLGLAVLFILMTRLGLPLFLRAASLLFVASSYGYWWYSVECEVYILPVPFILLTFYMIVRMNTAFSARLNHVLLALFYALAVLLHQQHALLLVAILTGYGFTAITRRHDIPLSSVLNRLTLFGILSALFVAVPYFYVIICVNDLSSVADITDWVLDYAVLGMDEGWGISGLLKGIIFAPRVVLGAHFVFCFNAVQSLLTRALPGKELTEEFFLVSGLPKSLIIALCSLTIGSIGSLAAVLVAALRNRVRLKHYLRSLPDATLCFCFSGCAFILVYAAFNIWWEPQNIEFWIAPYPIAIAILSIGAAPLLQERWIRNTILLGTGCLFLVNLLGSVLLQNTHARDYWYVFHRYAIEQLNEGDMLVSGVTARKPSYISDGYIDLYCPASTFLVGRYRLEHGENSSVDDLRMALQAKADSCKPRRVFIAIPQKGRLTDDAAMALLSPFLSDSIAVYQDEYQTVYRYEAPSQTFSTEEPL